MSKHIKKKFDEKYGPNWHCVVGKNFSSFVSYEAKNYIFFYEGQLAILLYKIGWKWFYTIICSISTNYQSTGRSADVLNCFCGIYAGVHIRFQLFGFWRVLGLRGRCRRERRRRRRARVGGSGWCWRSWWLLWPWGCLRQQICRVCNCPWWRSRCWWVRLSTCFCWQKATPSSVLPSVVHSSLFWRYHFWSETG